MVLKAKVASIDSLAQKTQEKSPYLATFYIIVVNFENKCVGSGLLSSPLPTHLFSKFASKFPMLKKGCCPKLSHAMILG